jgi:hypothetical protein
MGGSDKGKDNKAKAGKRQASGPSRQDLAAIRQALDEVADSEFDQSEPSADESNSTTGVGVGEQEAQPDTAKSAGQAENVTDQGWRNLSAVTTGDHEPFDASQTQDSSATHPSKINPVPPDEEFGDWDDELEQKPPSSNAEEDQPQSTDDDGDDWDEELERQDPQQSGWDDVTTGDNVAYQAPESEPKSSTADAHATTGDYAVLDTTNQSNVTTGEHQAYSTTSVSSGTPSSTANSDVATGEHVPYVATKATAAKADQPPIEKPGPNSPKEMFQSSEPPPAKNDTLANAPVHSHETGTFVPFDADAFARSQAQTPVRPTKAGRSNAAKVAHADATTGDTPPAVAAIDQPSSIAELPQEPAAAPTRTADGIEMSPAERSAQNIVASKDPHSDAEFDYDAHGRIVDVAVGNKRLHVEYNHAAATTMDPVKFTLESNHTLLAGGSANNDTTLSIDQRSGVVTCSYTTPTSTGSDADHDLFIEKQYDPDGTLVTITTNRKTKQRLTKEVSILSEERQKQAGKVTYEYLSQTRAPSDSPTAAAQVRATQTDEHGRTQHVYLFATFDDLQAHTPFRREDFIYEDKNGLRTELHQTIDLSTGEPHKVSETEKIVDLANNSTILTSQSYDPDQKLAVHQQVKFNASGYAEEFHYTDTVLQRELELTFDASARPQHFRSYDQGSDREFLCSFDDNALPTGESEQLSTSDKRDLLFCQMSIEAIAGCFAITNLECGNSASNIGPTIPRQGDAPTGTLVWNDGNNLKQARVERGTVYDAGNTAIGVITDKGSVNLHVPAPKSFNILDDQAAAAAFHGSGTDGQRLDLCFGQGSKPADRNEGLNGSFSNGAISYHAIGSKLYDNAGKFIAQVDSQGNLTFTESLRNTLSDVQRIDQFFKLGWTFVGNENGKPRRFNIDSTMSSGRIFLREIAPAAHKPRTERVSLIVPVEHEIRLNMIINKKTKNQIGSFIPPTDCGDSLSGGYVISGEIPIATPLANFVLAVFDVELLAHSGIAGRRIQGLSLGPESQADQTYKPSAGGLINLQHEINVEDRNLRQKLQELQARQQEEEKAKMRAQGLGFSATDWNSEDTLARLITSGFDNVVNCMKLTAAAQAAYQSAERSADEHRHLIKHILETADIDETSLVRVSTVSRSIGSATTSDDLAKLKNLVDNPPHILEDLPERVDTVFGSLKLPVRSELNGLIQYEIKAGRFYQKGRKDPVAFLSDKPGVLLWIDKHGQIYERNMKDLVGAVWHLQICDSNDVDHLIDWITLSNGKIVSAAQLRKQAANERAYAKALQEQNPNDDTVKALQRTVDLERRFNSRLDEVIRNGIPDDPKRPSHLSLSGTLAWLEAGTQAAVRAEQNRDRISQPLCLNTPNLTEESAAKSCGNISIGHERFNIDGGILYKLASDHAGAMTANENSSPALRADYRIDLANAQLSLASESHVILQLTIEGGRGVHRLIGLGKERTDSDGIPIAGGLIDLNDLLSNIKNVKEREALETSLKLLFDRESNSQSLNLIEFDQVAEVVQRAMKEANITVATAALANSADLTANKRDDKEQRRMFQSFLANQPIMRMLERRFTGGDEISINEATADATTTPLSEFLNTESGDQIPDRIVDCLVTPSISQTPAFERERSRIAQEMHLAREAVSDQLLLKHISYANLLDQLLRPQDETSLSDHHEEILTAFGAAVGPATATKEPLRNEAANLIPPGTLALPAEPGLPVAARTESTPAQEPGKTEAQPAEISFADLIAPLSDDDDDDDAAADAPPENKGTGLDAAQVLNKKEPPKHEPIDLPPASDVSFEQLMAPLAADAPPGVAASTTPLAVSADAPIHSTAALKEETQADRPTIKLRMPAEELTDDELEEPQLTDRATQQPPSERDTTSSATAGNTASTSKEIGPVSINSSEASEAKTPDFSAGLWTMPDLAELHRRSIDQRSTADTQLGEHLKAFKSHSFVQSKNMDDFVRTVKTRIQDWDDFRNFDPTEELEWHRSSLDSALNDFVARVGLPPIRLIIDSWMPGDAEPQYSLGNGVILMHPQDIQDARNVDISRLYHEVLHSEQDTAIIRKITLETLSQLNQLKPGRVMAEYCEQTGLRPNLVSRDWINTAVASSGEWLRSKSDHISELLRSNPNLSRDDVIDYDPELIRAEALTKSLREREESNQQLSRQYELLLFMHDQLSSHLQPHDYVENIQNNTGFRRMLFGYEWPNERSESYDRLNDDLIKAYDQEIVNSHSPDAVDKFDWKHKDAVKNILFQIEEDCLNHIRARRCKHFLGIDLELEANYAAHMLVMFHASGHSGVSRLLAFPTPKARQIVVEAQAENATSSGANRTPISSPPAPLDGGPTPETASKTSEVPPVEAEEESSTTPIGQTREYTKKGEISQPLVDGFAVIESARTADGAGRPFSPSRLPVIIDRSTDKNLAAAIEAIKSQLNENPDLKEDSLRLAQFFATATNKQMTPSGIAPDGQPWRLSDGRINRRKLIESYAAFFQEQIGKAVMLGDFIARAQQGLGGGQSEEQALMLKLLLDDAGIPNSLIRGHLGTTADSEPDTYIRPNHVWVEVTIGGTQYIIDVRSQAYDAVTLINKSEPPAQFYHRTPGSTRASSIDHDEDDNHRRHWIVYESRRWLIAKVNPATGLLTLHRPEQKIVAPADVIIDDAPLTVNEKFKIRNEQGKVDSGWYYRGRDNADNLVMYKPVAEKIEVARNDVLPEYLLTQIESAASQAALVSASSTGDLGDDTQQRQPDSR